MLPTSTKGSSAGSNSASVNQEYNTKATSMGNHSNSTTINATKSAPTILTLSKRLEHVNDADSEKCSKNGKCKYQYIKPQTLITEKQSHQEVDELTQQHSLIYYDGQLVSGSLEKLIEHMVPTCTYYPDKNFIISFLLSARLFIRPHELLSKISTKWEQQQQQQEASFDVLDDAQMFANCVQTSSSVSSFKGSVAGGAETNSKRKHHQELSRQLSAQNCIRLLAEWIETFPYDFRDERLMQQVRILARKCVYIDNALGKQVSCILQLLVQRLTVLEKYEEFLQSLETAHQKNFGSKISVVSTHIALGKNLHSANATDSKLTAAPAIENTHKTFQSSLSIGSSSRTHSVESHIQNSYRQQQNDNSTNSVNLTLHHLSGHFTNSNSASSINEDPGIMDFGLSPAQLAHQLTAIELERLSHIGPEEFVQAFAKEYIANQTFVGSREQDNACGSAKHAFRTTLNDIKITQNLEAYVQWFNRLSYFTATEIVKYPKKKQRVRAIEYWIETARECFNIGNFNSLVAIIAGLNLAPIARLKKTWCKVQSAKFSVLEHQMDPTSNFSSYRSTLKAAMWRSEGATNERERIIIPFFSLFVKDLYFLNEGCSNRLSNNHINFEKCSQLSKQVMEFIEWKKVACPFEKLPSVIMFLQSSAVMNENMLSIASFECEPPENTQEKGRYKTLKSETKHQMQQQLHDQQQ